jgi:hypothetical protein
LSARYGLDSQFENVTATVASLRFPFEVANETLMGGRDPVPMRVKMLIVEWQFGSSPHIVTRHYTEGDIVDFPRNTRTI